MRKFKWSNEAEVFEVDDSTDGGKVTCKDLLINGYKARIMRESFYYLNMKNNISTNFSEEQNYYANCVRKNLSPTR